jgi:hypothetical protein
MTRCARRVILLCGSAREREQQHALGRNPGEQQVRNPVCQRIRLARAGAGDDE